MKEGLRILEGVRAAGHAVVTDIHEPAQAEEAARAVDILQIPAFLCSNGLTHCRRSHG